MRNLRVHAGAGQSIARLTPIDRGILILTNHRLVFAGDLRNIDVPLTKVGGLRYESGVLEVYEEGRAKKLHFAADSCAAVIGRKLEYVLDGSSWSIDPSGMMLTRGGSPAEAPSREGSSDPASAIDWGALIEHGKALLEADGPLPLEVALGTLIASIVCADRMVTEQQLDAVNRAVKKLGFDAIEEQKIAHECDRMIAEFRLGPHVGVEDAINRLLAEPEDFRARLRWALVGLPWGSEAGEQAYAYISRCIDPPPEHDWDDAE
jgi:hypothetical protein